MEVATLSLDQLLQRSSRTFALTIPLLPPELCRIITIAYLLFRAADTFEDAGELPANQRITELNHLGLLLTQPTNLAKAEKFTQRFSNIPALPEEAGDWEVVQQLPYILEQLNQLPQQYQAIIVHHLLRTAGEMKKWLAQEELQGELVLTNLRQLEDYCYGVAGIVGEMSTEVFAAFSPFISPERHLYLKTLSNYVATGLQVTNIIKDSRRDKQRGRQYIPSDFWPQNKSDLAKLFPLLMFAQRNLDLGLEYVCSLPAEEPEMRQYYLLPLVLAAATLQEVADKQEQLIASEEVKISRGLVDQLVSRVKEIATQDKLIRFYWEQLTGQLRLKNQKFME